MSGTIGIPLFVVMSAMIIVLLIALYAEMKSPAQDEIRDIEHDYRRKLNAMMRSDEKTKKESHAEVIEPDIPKNPTPLDQTVYEFTLDVCRQYDVDPCMVFGIMSVESDFDNACVTGNCVGIMQVSKIHEDGIAKVLGREIHLEDIYDNIECGIMLFSILENKYGNDDHALMAYNCGTAKADDLIRAGVQRTRYSRHVLNERDRIFDEMYVEDDDGQEDD